MNLGVERSKCIVECSNDVLQSDGLQEHWEVTKGQRSDPPDPHSMSGLVWSGGTEPDLPDQAQLTRPEKNLPNLLTPDCKWITG